MWTSALTVPTAGGSMAPMPRTVLVSEGNSPLGAALARLLAARGCSVVTTEPRPAADGSLPGAASAGRTQLAVAWNRRSPVSAHTVFLDAINAFEAVDDVLILEPPCLSIASLPETPSADIECAFDDARGPVFLAREALAYFKRRGSGVLCMVSLGPAASPLEGGMRECFRGVCTSLLSTTGTAGVVVNGFQSGGVATEEYADFVDRMLEEKARKISGRWFTCVPHGGFFKKASTP
jgi:NAD(P)-dependent dehydrogenase (short-subunit alcohol dehydrogenase family)